MRRQQQERGPQTSNERITELERQVNSLTQQVNRLQEENQILKTQISKPVNKDNKQTQTEAVVEYILPGSYPKNK